MNITFYCHVCGEIKTLPNETKVTVLNAGGPITIDNKDYSVYTCNVHLINKPHTTEEIRNSFKSYASHKKESA